ncbi:MAG: hypothetical protein LUE61_08010 [Clostridiales bacterium]|nr:hypothetical protein [Clostridiales bacterium]
MFYRDGCLSDELIAEYDLEYLGMGRVSESCSEYAFPEKPVRNREMLIRHIKFMLSDPVTIFTERVMRSVQKGRRKNGVVFDLSGKDARRDTLQIYTPDGAGDTAFCQMCLRHKPYGLMEVNNLEKSPKYYFPQTRVALCLECSKKFEAYRENDKIREKYLEAIRNAKTESCGTVEIPVVYEDKLTFTATHLAEIQEIFKRLK